MLIDPHADHPVPGAVLVGSNHTRLDEITVSEIGLRCAVGLSRGRFPKGYPQVDPNEDAVVAFTNEDRWLMAVADGHGGAAAAEAAARAIASHASSLLTEHPEEAVRAATVLASRAVRDVNTEAGGVSSSRTALTIASIGEGVAYHAGAGDSAMYLISGRRVWRVDTPAPFMGGSDEADAPVRCAALPRAGGVILATDGLTDFLGRSWQKTIREARSASPAATARALITAAFEGGAGDNIAVAVWLGGRRLR